MKEGEQVELTTLDDVARVYCDLPDDRAELMLSEVSTAIRYFAGLKKICGLLGGEAIMEPLGWINDTKGETTVNLRTEDELIASFKTNRGDSAA